MNEPSLGLTSITPPTPLSEEQRALVERPLNDTLFIEGPAGTGKTSVGVARLCHLLRQGVPADEILVLAPQRTLLAPYQLVLYSPDLPPRAQVDTLTIGGLARRMVDLFWPLISERAGFDHPDRPPVFLTLETAQYYMAHITDPQIESGAFEGVTIDRNRLLSQILDNLNKAALVGLDYTQVGERLRRAWAGADMRASVYDTAQECANKFRAYCLKHNLLDFSLQIEVFIKHLLKLPWPPHQGFMKRFTRYRHLIADNVEEGTPVTHDLLRDWVPHSASALLIYDQDAGNRLFLGADPAGAHTLYEKCRYRTTLCHSFVNTPDLQRLGYELARTQGQTPTPPPEDEKGHPRQALTFSTAPLRFHTQMLTWAAEEIAQLVHQENVPPDQIVVLAPYLSDALRFSLIERLKRLKIPTRSHRPSRALRDEPTARCLLTMAALAHPAWHHAPLPADVVHALALSIAPLDMVRAQLLTHIVYRPHKGRPSLTPFADIKTSTQERIGYQAGNRYDALRQWLYQNAGTPAQPEETPGDASGDRTADPQPKVPLDHFFSRLFGEVLSKPGYGLHQDMDAGRVAAQLIESAQKFRSVASLPETSPQQDPPVNAVGLEYVRMVERGVIAAQYVPAWRAGPEDEGTVLLAPAYTFLMRNQAVDYQFWLNVGSLGWWQRPHQPLTHPYVLTRHWQRDAVWTDAHQVQAQRQALHRLVQGLVRRCRVKIYLGVSELGERGYEQSGPLLDAIQSVLRRQRDKAPPRQDERG